MKGMYVNQKAREDFNKAKNKATIANVLNTLTPQKQTLLSLQDVRALIGVKNEAYKGMQVIPIEKIVGSEGRYQDFSKEFFPKYEHLRHRWESIDKAHLTDVILPPIKLYKIGDVYFVSDGNHRVSVARMQGVRSIDAEVIEIDSDFNIHEDTTVDELRSAVIAHEKDHILNQVDIADYIPLEEIEFTEPGRYTELLRHIQGHKYFLGLEKDLNISFPEACQSWYENLYLPIVTIIDQEKYLQRFPRRTHSDLYMWIIKHWHSLKKKYGNNFSMKAAADDYSKQFGTSFKKQFYDFLKKWKTAIFK